MHIIKIKEEELLLVEVPMEAERFTAHSWEEDFYLYYDLPDARNQSMVLDFDSERSYSILGTITNGVPDFDVEPYVERFTLIMDYRNYIPNATKNCISAKQSFLSLLESHSIPYKSTKLICLKARK